MKTRSFPSLSSASSSPLEFVAVQSRALPILPFVDSSTEDIDNLRPGNKWQFYVVVGDEQSAEATGFTISADAEVIEEAENGTNETNETV